MGVYKLESKKTYRLGTVDGLYWAQDIRTGVLVYDCKSESEAVIKLKINLGR